MKANRLLTIDPTLPFWLSPGYRRALLVDSFKHFYRGIANITDWRKAGRSVMAGLRLLSRYVGKRVQRAHLLKYETIWEIFSRTGFPQVIVEVGSFNGLDSLEFSRMFPSARVYAFEADPRNYKAVKRNVSIRKQITPIPQAVFNFTGQGVFHASGGDGGGSGSMLFPRPKLVETFPHITFGEQFPVDTTTLSDWSQQNDIKKIDLIWMDAQGAELHILQGMEDLLSEVHVVLLEVWTQPYYEGSGILDELQDYLRGFGFYQTHTWMDGNAGDALFQRT